MLRYAAGAAALLVGALSVSSVPSEAEVAGRPLPAVETTVSPVRAAVALIEEQRPTTTTSTTVVPASTTTAVAVEWVAAPAGARCPDWWLPAQVAGWEPDLLPVLDWVIWRESRCLPDVVGTGGYGLLQIQWSVHRGWVEPLGFERGDLLEPAVNLAVGRVLWQMAEDDGAFLCGWSPWYMSQPGRHWCAVEVSL